MVLPLLEEQVVEPGWVAPEDFLAGYDGAVVVVSCGDERISLATDETGRFDAPPLPAGSCTLAASLPGIAATGETFSATTTA